MVSTLPAASVAEYVIVVLPRDETVKLTVDALTVTAEADPIL